MVLLQRHHDKIRPACGGALIEKQRIAHARQNARKDGGSQAAAGIGRDIAANIVGDQRADKHGFDGDQKKIPTQLPEGEYDDGDIDQNRQPAHRQMEQIIPKHRQSADAAGRKIGLHGEADDAAAQKQRADDIIGQHFPVVFLHNNASFCCSARLFWGAQDQRMLQITKSTFFMSEKPVSG